MSEPPLHEGWERIWRERGDPHYEGTPQPQVVELAERLKAQGRSRVLDLGCGAGRNLRHLAGEGFDAWGCDVSPSALAASRRALAESGLLAGVVRAEMSALPFRSGVFDAVIAWDVIFHTTVEGILRTVEGVRRSLRDGGLFLLTFNSTESSHVQRSREAVARGEGEELEPGTFVLQSDGFDKALPHHYATEEEIRTRLLAGLEVVAMHEYRREYEDERGKQRPVKWWVLARKTERSHPGAGEEARERTGMKGESDV